MMVRPRPCHPLYCKLLQHRRPITVLSIALLIILTILLLLWLGLGGEKDRSLRDKFGHRRKRPRKKRGGGAYGWDSEEELSDAEKYRRRMKYGNEANRNNLERMAASQSRKKLTSKIRLYY
ncbi:uncharacterized protein LOC113471431 isoform X2 [Diaphorina citri]|uniref:Uncharacterized protein LOC113471431 isoform X1 n=1 Tax=Diaphorina citri TaxID=121845 RepID=A0A3Q0JCY2_DIACI|nr:uncharacterized protein LOC113471431 isoform X1 [Diaphorina citri]XP_026686373.1 uncharacterized protein LOC113471431 isoform X2 [Diaphorina citri]KAI5694620.1 hypothetical protein M8J75_002163 [Diaphorina citri]KAI5716179.1 hypothetical protein M8J76_002217 [Diaphorina citri]